MKHVCFSVMLAVVMVANSIAFAQDDAKDALVKPNVVLILTDDLGWQDVKCYDIDQPSPMETPNIDALAKKGVMFWQAYAPSPSATNNDHSAIPYTSKTCSYPPAPHSHT